MASDAGAWAGAWAGADDASRRTTKRRVLMSCGISLLRRPDDQDLLLRLLDALREVLERRVVLGRHARRLEHDLLVDEELLALAPPRHREAAVRAVLGDRLRQTNRVEALGQLV